MSDHQHSVGKRPSSGICKEAPDWTSRLVTYLKQPDVIFPVPPDTQIPLNRLPISQRKQEDRQESRSSYLKKTIWYDVRKIAFSERLYKAIAKLDESVESKPRVLAGTLVLRGTRFSVAQLFGELAEGESIDTIADDFELDRDSLSALLHAMAVCFDSRTPK
jgi:uncharacterized protein (DUF433 family)